MTERFTKLAAVLSILAIAGLNTPSAKSLAASGSHPPLSGVNVTDFTFGVSNATVDQEIAWARSLDAHVIRVEIPWSRLEPSRGEIDAHALAFTDNLVEKASAAGIKVVALTLSTPCWDSSAPAHLLRQCKPEQSKANAWPPSDARKYGSFVAFLAARYRSKLAAIEVWNEPDQANEDYLAGPDKAQHYATILRAAYPAIKRADPSMKVLGGSLVGSNGTFLRALYASGIKGYYDGLSVHFYTLVLGALRYIHEVQLENGDTKPVWLNEFGWSSCWPRQRIQQEQACVTTQTQALDVANIYRSLARTPWIAAEIDYELHGSRSEDFGALAEGGERKPSFRALRSVFISPFGMPSAVTVHLSRRGGRIMASGSGPPGDYMQLEVFSGQQPLYRALFTLDRFNHYSLALPRALGTGQLKVSVFQNWMGATKAASATI